MVQKFVYFFKFIKAKNLDLVRLVLWALESLVVLSMFFVLVYLIVSKESYDVNADYDTAKLLGVVSLAFLMLTSLPGILSRLLGCDLNKLEEQKSSGKVSKFALFWEKFLRLMFKYRGEFGKLAFLFVFFHFLLIKFVPIFLSDFVFFMRFFELMGFIAFVILFLIMFFSILMRRRNVSSESIQKNMQRLFYLATWFVFLHVFLASWFSVLSIVVLVWVLLETFSLFKVYWRSSE